MHEVRTDKAPKAIGPYSQAVVAGDFVHCSGQIGIDPTSSALVSGGIAAETERSLENLSQVLQAAGSGLESVASVTIYLKNIDDFKIVNELYAKRFSSEPKPARITVGVAALPKGACIEIACVAVKKRKK